MCLIQCDLQEKVVEVNHLDVGPVLRDKLTYGGGTTRDGEGTT